MSSRVSTVGVWILIWPSVDVANVSLWFIFWLCFLFSFFLFWQREENIITNDLIPHVLLFHFCAIQIMLVVEINKNEVLPPCSHAMKLFQDSDDCMKNRESFQESKVKPVLMCIKALFFPLASREQLHWLSVCRLLTTEPYIWYNLVPQ